MAGIRDRRYADYWGARDAYMDSLDAADYDENPEYYDRKARAVGERAVSPRVYTGADQAPGTRMGAGGDFRPYKPQDGRNFAPRSGLVRTENPVDSWRGMTRQQALNGGVGRVYDALAHARVIDDRNHLDWEAGMPPTAAVGGHHYDVGSRDHFAAIAMDPSKSNFEREQARRQMETMARMDRMDAENAAIRRAPPVILQPGVRAYREDGTRIGEGSALSEAPRGPVFGQRGVALPNENGGYSVEWAPLEQPKPVLANDGSAAFDPQTGEFIENKYRKVPAGAAQNEPVWDENVGKWFVGGKVVADTELSALLTELSNIQKTTDFTDTDGSRKQAALEDVRRRIEERKRVLSGGAQGAPATGTQGTQGGWEIY